MQSLVVFDICNTLFFSNTTFDFINYCVVTRKISVNKFLYSLTFSKKSPFRYFLLLFEKVIGREFIKSKAIALFKGKSIEEVDVWAETFIAEVLSEKQIWSVRSILEANRSSKIILASATIEPVALAISRALSIDDCISTKLMIIDGRYSGEIEIEITGNKADLLFEKYPQTDFRLSLAVSDNYSDLNLLKSADLGVAVCHSLIQIKWWEKHNRFKVIDLTNQINHL